jgi:hypothetical protein
MISKINTKSFKLKKFLIVTLVSISSFFSCEKNDEIFDGAYAPTYGTWKLIGVSGGFIGTGHELNFDYLKLEKPDNYSFIKGNSILENGIIQVIDQNNTVLQIKFVPNKSSGILMFDPEKFVEISHKDTLNLNAPCCDRYNYHFARVKDGEIPVGK